LRPLVTALRDRSCTGNCRAAADGRKGTPPKRGWGPALKDQR
jgi:hypothetical protein